MQALDPEGEEPGRSQPPTPASGYLRRLGWRDYLIILAGAVIGLHWVVIPMIRALWPSPIKLSSAPSLTDRIFAEPLIIFGIRLLIFCVIPVAVTGTAYITISFLVRIKRGQWMSKFLWVEISDEALAEPLKKATLLLESLKRQILLVGEVAEDARAALQEEESAKFERE